MSITHQQHPELLEINERIRSLFARRFFSGDLTLADATLRLKQAPASDWYQFRSGMHVGVLVMLTCWAAWASRLVHITLSRPLKDTHMCPRDYFMYCM